MHVKQVWDMYPTKLIDYRIPISTVAWMCMSTGPGKHGKSWNLIIWIPGPESRGISYHFSCILHDKARNDLVTTIHG